MTPVPVTAMFSVGFAPSDVIVRFPLTAPAAVGANFTLNVVLCPAVSVTGRVNPLKVIPAPLMVAAEIVTLVPPELVRVSFKDLLFPITTLPKARLVGFAPSCPGVTPVP